MVQLAVPQSFVQMEALLWKVTVLLYKHKFRRSDGTGSTGIQLTATCILVRKAHCNGMENYVSKTFRACCHSHCAS